MSDNLFERLKQVLDDGLILTPDVDVAIEIFEKQHPSIAEIAHPIISKASRTNLFIQNKAAVLGDLVGIDREDEDYENAVFLPTYVMFMDGICVGIMLGLLAAERIKTEVAK